MAMENGVWTMYGMDWDDPYWIRSCRELINWINGIGFIRDFRQKRNKEGAEYGMAVSVYMTPEELWGYDLVTSAYKETPEESRERIYRHVRGHYPNATEKQINILMK